MESHQFIETENFIDILHILKTISEQEGCTINDIIIYPSMTEDYEENYNNFLHVKQVPIKIDVPEQFGKTWEFCPTGAPVASKHDRTRMWLHEHRILNQQEMKEPRLKNREDGKGKETVYPGIKYWRWWGGKDHSNLNSSIFVLKKDNWAFIRRIKKTQKAAKPCKTPILPAGVLTEIYNNSIGFLLNAAKNKDKYKEYEIPIRRGILLCGTPGCGKTMTCKWLRQLAIKHGFMQRIVTMEEYQNAQRRGNIGRLFRMHRQKPGLVFFDDMDIMAKDRETGNSDIYNFLTQMDGIENNEGVVFIFTTNVVKDLDSAFVRPGRIDLFLTFNPPSSALRKKYIESKYPKVDFDLDKLVKDTDEHSFAELEEIRKLFCLEMIQGKKPDMEKIFKLFQKHRTDFLNRDVGFNRMENDPNYEPDAEALLHEVFGEEPDFI